MLASHWDALMTLTEFPVLDESDIQILKTYVGNGVCVLRRKLMC